MKWKGVRQSKFGFASQFPKNLPCIYLKTEDAWMPQDHIFYLFLIRIHMIYDGIKKHCAVKYLMISILKIILISDFSEDSVVSFLATVFLGFEEKRNNKCAEPNPF